MIMFPDSFGHDTLTPITCNLSSLACDRHHHHYHYQSSAQYLWLARTCRALGRPKDAQGAYGKALFQDHFNAAAKEEKERGTTSEERGVLPEYDKHPLWDSAFCASIGKRPTDATTLHDEAVSILLAGRSEHALMLLDKAVTGDPMHSNSFFARGRYWFMQQDYDSARKDFEEAIRLSHLHHDHYHRFASDAHYARGELFLRAGELDLAIAGFSKALDLYPRNTAALSARAQAYRAKGNAALAEQDEQKAHGRSG